MNIEQLYQHYLAHPSVQTDTRKLQPGDIFFALRGPTFNGNQYAAAALEAGASLAVIDDPAFHTAPDKMMLAADALHALQQLARRHRQQFDIPFIAITGTNGKTTTKEMVRTVLGSHYRTYATAGNLNNHIGVPLTLLGIPANAEMAVIEMGANHQREIAGYCTVALPTHGLITNIGKAHLEGFGGEEGVRKAKGELYDYLRDTNGTAFVCTDYPYLLDMSKGIAEVVTYGSANAGYTGKPVEGSALLALGTEQTGLIHTRLVGGYNFPNVMAAIAIGLHFGVPAQKIKTAIEAYVPANNRSQIEKRGGNTFIMDAYNANPSSMKAAVENFAAIKAAQKVLLLGAMKELGEDSEKEHQALADLLQQQHWKAVVLVGPEFAAVNHPYIFMETADDARKWLEQQGFENTHILVKGSRSVGMEKVLP
ncbi:UDP-N-acetylmuramoylalanyl-D-glutamate--2,6-diaminopimelate ligase [Chitinophaga alhagiae]|uniref:UDP-N-acetylmuramoyl-tripeptide--D-alanyl-D-alanine ligase n=1 Tax=Chitinophaga alhagiae TaxID=2203219 RepID=A0ABM6WD30_9BACT|nr:UDP-N-acetylmuramoyl-tripeptide--D-alanyl-D-alanine ligase [Chitinophaga alhagiae]AWO01875.1 UDP-N-acetylmuramoylalanyl-D-glutamate--2,6-diaminopimelate ligase [Chitinophaga alhagiae]